MKPFYLCLVLIPVFCWFYMGCRKDKTANVPGKQTGLYDFTFDNDPKECAGLTFTPGNSVPQNSTYLWTFGDGGTYTERTGMHAYSVAGTYEVALLVNGDSSRMVKKTITVKPNYVFGTTGGPCIGDTFSFYFVCDIPAGTTFLWEFGDGSTSTDRNPVHAYAAKGTYTVKMTANNIDMETTQVTVYADPLYTLHMTTPRIWHGTQHYHYTGMDTTYNYTDSAFSLEFVSKVTVRLSSYMSFTYSEAMSGNNTIVFTGLYDATHLSTVSYNYVNDSMSIYLYLSGQGAPGAPPYVREYNWWSP